MENRFSCIARIGDIIKVNTTDGATFEGLLSHLGQIVYDGNIYDYEFLISETTFGAEDTFGAVVLQTSDIKSVSVVNNYSALKDTKQDEILNIDKVKTIMKCRGMTVSDLALRMKKDRPSVSKIINRKRKNISLQTAVSMAKALGVSVDEIVNK